MIHPGERGQEWTMQPNVPHHPLSGIRVVEAARVLAGPFCGQQLADLGAEVLKLERPGTGDDTRAWGPPFHGEFSAYFLSCNRNKKSITLDFSTPEGHAKLQELLACSDVLIENFRADSLPKLGLTVDELCSRHPRLILCSISGYGRTGPLKDAPGYDFAIQAASGLMSITGPPEGPPFKVGVAVVDVLTGLYACTAILACLHARERTGHGYAIDLALHDCALAAQVNVAQAFLTSGQVSPRLGNAHLQIVPYRTFATADGWIVLNVGNDLQWKHFCDSVERPDWAADERFRTNPDRVRTRTVLEPLVEEVLSTRSTADWRERFDRNHVPHSVVRNHAEVFADPAVLARGMKVTVRDPDGNPVDLLGSPYHIGGCELPVPTMPPRLGEHNQP